MNTNQLLKDIKEIRFSKGPNFFFYISSAFILYLSYANNSFMPLIIWFASMFIFIIVTIVGSSWDRKQGRKMLEDFPYDPIIQRKYARYRK